MCVCVCYKGVPPFDEAVQYRHWVGKDYSNSFIRETTDFDKPLEGKTQ